MDAEKRRNTLIITGIPEDEPLHSDADANGIQQPIQSDEDKVQHVLSKIGHGDKPVSSVERLGIKKSETRSDGSAYSRAVKVTLTNPSHQKLIVASAKKLKDEPEPLKKVYVKKDMHPGVRRELNRLRQAERSERENPDNNGRDIQYDPVARTLSVDGVIVDRFRSSFFQ